MTSCSSSAVNADYHLFAINKRESIRISWHGNADCFSRNQHALLNALDNGTIAWQRENKSSTLPLNLRFTPLLIPYSQSTSIYSNSRNIAPEHSTNATFAFVHVYFVNAGSFEEYRLNVRPEISEWFANLNEANETHWIILIDTAKASKDKKAKNQLVDKIKSDFSRFQNRLFEFTELSNERTFAAFSVFFQATLFASFDFYTNNLNTNIDRLKGTIKDNSFRLQSLVNEQFRLSRFYWNLGLFDTALTELELLAIYISDSIRALAKKENLDLIPQWLKQFRLLPLGRSCILLGTQMYLDSVVEEFSLLNLHAHLLAHQFLILAQNLQHRLSLAATPVPLLRRSRSQPSSPSIKPKAQRESQAVEESEEQQKLKTIQLRHNTVASVLKFAHETIQRFEEDMLALRANCNTAIFHCLILVWQAELFKYCEYLLGTGNNIIEVNSISTHLNFLNHKKCEAVHYLYTTIKAGISEGSSKAVSQKDVTVVRLWLDSTPLSSTPPDISIKGASTSELQHRQQSALAEESARLFRVISGLICKAMDGDGMQAFADFTVETLLNAFTTFEHYGWRRHAYYVREQLAELLKDLAPEESYTHFYHNLRVFLTCPYLMYSSLQNGVDALERYMDCCRKNLLDNGNEEKETMFDCCMTALSFISQMPEHSHRIEGWLSQLTELANIQDTKTLTTNDLVLRTAEVDRPFSRLLDRCPLKIIRVRSKTKTSPFIYCTIHSALSFHIILYNSLELPLSRCNIKAIFRPISDEMPYPSSNSFSFRHLNCTENEPGKALFLECLPAIFTASKPNNELLELHSNNVTLISKSETSCILGLDKIEVTGCFYLDSVLVKSDEFGAAFFLDYQDQMARSKKLEQVLCFVDAIQPKIQIKHNVQDCNEDVHHFMSGMEQQFCLELSPGTEPIYDTSKLNLSLTGSSIEGSLDFLDQKGNWAPKAEFSIVPLLDVNDSYSLLVRMCMGINRIEAGESDGYNHENIEKYELLVGWFRENDDSSNRIIMRTSFPLSFRPIMRLIWSTSILTSSLLFKLDLCRKKDGNDDTKIEPFEATLRQEQNIAEEPVEATLLTAMPFKTIDPDSTFRLVWRLPESRAGKSLPITHLLSLKYRVETKNDQKSITENGHENGGNKENLLYNGREYILNKRVDFPLQKIEYEVCACFFSEQSQSVLCRLDQPTEIVVSLRSLAKTMSEAETLIVRLESNLNHYWYCSERNKLARVKESGVGQIIFTVVPKQLGLLPFPAISLYKYNNTDHSPSRQQSINEKHFGERLLVFYRNRNCTIHIFGASHVSEETSSLSSVNTTESSSTNEQKKKSLKSAAKDRLQKLFE